MKRSMQILLCGMSVAWAGWAGAQTATEAIQPAVEAPAEVPTAVETPVRQPLRAPGAATRQLLQAQAQGDSASAHQYPMSGVVAQKTYERYVNSFTHPIPEQSASTIAKSSK